MLIYFKVANYKSINDPVVINFAASSISEHVDSNIISFPDEQLLKSILLYGPNAGGKSNILKAFLDFRWLITNTAKESQGNEPLRADPFLLSTSTRNAPSFFEACFILDNVKYRYGFEADRECIHKEWLLESKAVKEYPLFLRVGQDFQIDEKRFKNGEGLQKRTRKNALFMSVASQWNVDKAEKINDWFADILTIHGLMDGLYKDLTTNMLEDERYREKIKELICKADMGIVDVEVVNIPMEELLDENNFNEDTRNKLESRYKDRKPRAVFSLHNLFDDDNNIKETIPFLLNDRESEGTKKYFNFIGALILALEQNRLVIFDEFDARFHTLLSKAILELFNSNANKSHSQLLVASHDTALLDKELLRRDQIYFVEKNKFGATHVNSLVEFKVRKEAPYDKNYLNGKFGAIPMIENLESALKNE